MEPLRLRALSGDATLLRAWHCKPFRGRVHSVFKRVVNLVDVDDGLATLSSRGVDDAPDTLVVDVPALTGHCSAGEPARSERGVLRVGRNLVVDFAAAQPWQPWLPQWPSDPTLLPGRLAKARARLRAVAAVRTSLLARAAAALLDHRAAALHDALRAGDTSAARLHASALVGLGPGLTPSGDDFLVGLFAALHVAGAPASAWRWLCADVVHLAAARTHAISLAALRAAAHGRVRASIATLLRALLSGSPQEAETALDEVLAIGSTSGADLAAGILAGIEAHVHAMEGQIWKPRSTSRAA